jgi:hypothetical protein
MKSWREREKGKDKSRIRFGEGGENNQMKTVNQTKIAKSMECQNEEREAKCWMSHNTDKKSERIISYLHAKRALAVVQYRLESMKSKIK